ncbi:hypothetical protein IQ260_29145 [Leptolyngbya cf. ectocarpi LEGE 11479]|uniref:Uncharacterized protein n=1 Tax=Leptolyngbya cf. ectocarpi LEGE 11479 TaxID=1828722 RepID=A0A929A0C5_LEPEC|nr:hypothetical protein [Leptolyngbya ectocarpi]MBE9070711.1 hypothetical protein [Leptolyngbya cf. ectocarpi LEGE 11479]
MKQQHLNAYLKLIQELLACPNGEEWICLKQHEDLVDAELIQVMEQVASQLLHKGNRQAAIFLHNWAAKLHHILVKEKQPTQSNDDLSQAYLALIQSLLEGSEDTRKKLLAEHSNLIGPGLVHAMKQAAQQLRQQDSDASATYLENLATELNQAWIEAHDFQPKLKKEALNTPFKTHDSTAASEVEALPPNSEAESPTSGLNQETTASSSATTALPLNMQQLTNAIHKMSQALYQLNQTLSNQRTSPNPLWYMDVLERAATAQWLLTTDEIEQLIGVRPKCHGKDKTYQRGTWTFMKVGKLGAQTAWKVTKTKLNNPVLDSDDEVKRYSTDDHDRANSINSVESLAKHPPLKQTILNNGTSDNEQLNALEIPEMEDIWA